MNTARKPEPSQRGRQRRTSSSANAMVCTGYSAVARQRHRRISCSSSQPPATPTAAPTPICSANSPSAAADRRPAAAAAPSRLTISAMPTGSLAPDSPSSSVPDAAGDLPPAEDREHHRRVGRARARRRSAARRASRSRTASARATASAPAVTTVPATPSHSDRRRPWCASGAQPMCMPPSNRMITRATVTIRWSVTIGSPPSLGTRSAAAAAATGTAPAPGTRTRRPAGWSRRRRAGRATTSRVVTANGTRSCTR